jgi:ketosteroid isomerase-like protein
MLTNAPELPQLEVISIVTRFNNALNARDLEGMMQWVTEDTVFENTYPPPDGERYLGKSAVRLFWEDFFKGSSQAKIEIEEIFAFGDRCVMRWTYQWANPEGQSGHIRGVDIYRLENGLIAEKLSYVKG